MISRLYGAATGVDEGRWRSFQGAATFGSRTPCRGVNSAGN